jgi:hypothetical protein
MERTKWCDGVVYFPGIDDDKSVEKYEKKLLKMKDIIKRLSELNIADIEIAKDLIIEARSMIQLGGLDA